MSDIPITSQDAAVWKIMHKMKLWPVQKKLQKK